MGHNHSSQSGKAFLKTSLSTSFCGLQSESLRQAWAVGPSEAAEPPHSEWIISCQSFT